MPRLRSFRGPLQFRYACLDVLYLDRLGRVIEDCLCRPYFDGRGRVRIDHRFQQSGGRRSGSLLEPCDGLAERGPACLTIGCLELRHLELTPTPEPTTVALALSGFGGLWLIRRRLNQLNNK